MQVKITFTREVLGSQPDAATWKAYIASKSADAEKIKAQEEALSAEELENKGTTTFYRFEEKPALADYQIKGFFKEACSIMSKIPESKSKELKAFRKMIDGAVMVYPEFIPMTGELSQVARPLRAQTAQGERVSLVNSEAMTRGTTCEFEVVCLDPKLEKYVTEWLDYGKYKGLGQWRNSGKGRFEYEIVEEKK